MGQEFIFEDNFLGQNFNLGHEKKLTFFSMVTTRKGGKNTPTKQTKENPSNKTRSEHTPEASHWDKSQMVSISWYCFMYLNCDTNFH